jgi:DNA-binding NarL/FixJ family response regulator
MSPTAQERNVVLLVDDTPANLAYLSDALDEAGYKVLVAIDGKTALDRLTMIRPDIILLDAVMPGMDGFETCRAIKQTPPYATIPVIFMTGLVETEHVVRGFSEGAIDYVTKPVRPEEALARIATHISRARMLDKAQLSVDAGGRAGLTVDARGAITWATPRARQWLEAHLDEETSPEGWSRLHAWLELCNRSDGRGSVVPLTLSRDDVRLRITDAGLISGGDRLLLLQEQRADVTARTLADAYGLTTRETEVLGWIAAGKTNRDIAQILGMSPRTVNKHLEHIYVKLGVETRAAAAAIATQTLGPSGRSSPPHLSINKNETT